MFGRESSVGTRLCAVDQVLIIFPLHLLGATTFVARRKRNGARPDDDTRPFLRGSFSIAPDAFRAPSFRLFQMPKRYVETRTRGFPSADNLAAPSVDYKFRGSLPRGLSRSAVLGFRELPCGVTDVLPSSG